MDCFRLMAVRASFSLGQFLRKNSVVIFFPVFTITSIYADYSHTQKWKAQKALELAKNKNDSN